MNNNAVLNEKFFSTPTYRAARVRLQAMDPKLATAGMAALHRDAMTVILELEARIRVLHEEACALRRLRA